MWFTGDWIWHASWLVLILGVMALNRAMAKRSRERSIALEAQKLRTGLATELRMLGELYRTNVTLLEKNANYVLSTRSPLLICRSNLGRLTELFEAAAIEHLVTLFAHNEILEAHIAAHARPKAGLSFRFPRHVQIEPFVRMYTEAAQYLERTQTALDRLDAAKPPRLGWKEWLVQGGKSRAQETSAASPAWP
jgi:hypothetical protein